MRQEIRGSEEAILLVAIVELLHTVEIFKVTVSVAVILESMT